MQDFEARLEANILSVVHNCYQCVLRCLSPILSSPGGLLGSLGLLLRCNQLTLSKRCLLAHLAQLRRELGVMVDQLLGRNLQKADLLLILQELVVLSRQASLEG